LGELDGTPGNDLGNVPPGNDLGNDLSGENLPPLIVLIRPNGEPDWAGANDLARRVILDVLATSGPMSGAAMDRQARKHGLHAKVTAWARRDLEEEGVIVRAAGRSNRRKAWLWSLVPAPVSIGLLEPIRQHLERSGELRPGSVVHIEVRHDDGCAHWTGGRCDCAPELETGTRIEAKYGAEPHLEVDS
jgi:hypothetical protein